MALSPELQRLIDVSAPLWAGEAEVVRTYWTSPVRTLETDLLWIRRQCSKEFSRGRPDILDVAGTYARNGSVVDTAPVFQGI